MSCCGNKRLNREIENYINNPHNPNNFERESGTYVLDSSAYYAPPMPATRTMFDSGLQTKFNPQVTLPDYLNFRNTTPRVKSFQPSIENGRYDRYNY